MPVTTVVLDEAASDQSVAPVQYNISSFGADYDVEGLVRRLNRGDIFIPSFQRDYVWSEREASRFIESLLLGLPVPGVFLARDTTSNRLFVIDGQQRLKSLQFFFNGYFNPREDAAVKRVFRLTKVQRQFEGRTYEALSSDDQRILNDSIIHATIVKQDSPKDDDTSIYHIFERLNTSGKKLTPQEIRVAIYYSEFIELIKTLNDYPTWREVYGPRSNTLKDQELILRFLALYFAADQYSRPMKEFLNKFTIWARKQDHTFFERCRFVFIRTIDALYKAIGPRLFRPERALNAATFDSIMVGLATRLEETGEINLDRLADVYKDLISNPEYLSAIAQATSDEKNVAARLQFVTSRFESI